MNISGRFASHDIVSALAIFDPRKVPSTDSTQLPSYGKKSIEVLLDHYGIEKPALTFNQEETVKAAVRYTLSGKPSVHY